MTQQVLLRPDGYLLRRALEVLELMSRGDTHDRVSKLIQRQIAAEAEYARIAHRGWGKFPHHPAAEGLAALHRHVAGDRVDVEKFLGLAWLGELLAMHHANWKGREDRVAARLRSSAPNFLGCLFELEASHLARSWGHITRWLWPHNPADADIDIDGEIAGECVHAAKATEARVPAHAARDLAQALSNAMQRHGRNLNVRLVVAGKAGPELSVIRDVLTAAVAAGESGSVRLPVNGYEATIEELGPLDAPLSDAAANALLSRFGQYAIKFGTVERSSLGIPRNPRFVVIEAPGGTPAIASAARSAADKHDQVPVDRPTVVWVKFGQPVDIGQASDPLVQLGATQAVRAALAKKKAHRVSAVVWVFGCSVLFPPTGHGFIIREPNDERQPTFRSFFISNPVAAKPVSAEEIIPH